MGVERNGTMKSIVQSRNNQTDIIKTTDSSKNKDRGGTAKKG